MLSVLLSVKDGESYIEDCLKSIVNQTYSNWELIVIDDGSTDRTVKIVESFNDHRIRLFKQPNHGLAYSLNRAANLANGELLIRHDADDLSKSNRFGEIVQIFNKNRNIVLIATDVEVIDHLGDVLSERQIISDRKEAIRSIEKLINPFVHGSLAFPRKAFEEVGGYDESFSTSQDFDLIVRLLRNGEIAVLSTPLYKLRIHPESVSNKKWFSQVKSQLRIVLGSFKKSGFTVSYLTIFIYFTRKFSTFLIRIGANDSSAYYYRLGCEYLKLDNYNQAHEYFATALDESPYFLLCRMRKIILLLLKK